MLFLNKFSARQWFLNVNFYNKGSMKNVFTILFLCFPFLIQGMHDFVYLSVPKSGTHLLQKVLEEMTGLKPQSLRSYDGAIESIEETKKNNQFLYTHNLLRESKVTDYLVSKNYKIILIYRDPRDQLISFIFWIANKKPPHPIYKDFDTELTAYINGHFHEAWFVPFYEQVNIMPSDSVLKIRYEDLVGSRGGGNDDVQFATILEIANFLDISISEEKSRSIFDKVWGHSKTFRKGIIGDWKNYFTEEHIRLYKKVYGNVLIDLHYEDNTDW